MLLVSKRWIEKEIQEENRIYHILDEIIEPVDIRDLPPMKTLCGKEVDNSYSMTDDFITPSCKKCVAVLNARYALDSKE